MKSLRVYIDKDKHDIYERLVKRGGENPDQYPFQTMKDVFLFAACMGLKYNHSEELKSSQDIFNTDVFDARVDIPVLSALAFSKEKDIAILSDEKKILEIVQEYANGGISYVRLEILNNPGKPLNSYIELINSYGKI